MSTAGALERGRGSFDRHEWGNAVALLSAADQKTPLEPDDLELLATATHLTGANADEAWTRAHHVYLERGLIADAARCAFWLAFNLVNKGEFARGGGWFARAQKLIEEGDLDCVERGYLLMPVAIGTIDADPAASLALFERAVEIARRFGERDLVAMAGHGRGRALIKLGRIAEGVALLDEAMVAITAGEVSPKIAGTVYCSVIEACGEIFDLRRAQEWTAALTRWCESQPDLVPYRGQCLIHRSQILQVHGDWQDALAAARTANEWLSRPPPAPALGAAYYQAAELHRLRGESTKAEEAYRAGNERGRIPQPGLALLRLAQDRIDQAEAGIRAALVEAHDRATRSGILPAYVDVMLAAGHVGEARGAAEELAQIATHVDAPLLLAAAAYADGAVRLAEGDPKAALAATRDAWSTWQEIGAPYETARARIQIAMASVELGDADTAQMELDAARGILRRLGATPELARLEKLAGRAAPAAGGLTARELEVLRLVAAGKTNRGIADELVISEKTVARHVSNMFTKLGVQSRAAATAYAYEHGLV